MSSSEIKQLNYLDSIGKYIEIKYKTKASLSNKSMDDLIGSTIDKKLKKYR